MLSRKRRKNSVETSRYHALAELYQALFERATEGIFIADGQKHFVEVNSCGCQMLGYTHQEILSLSWQDIIPVEEPPLHPDEMQADKTMPTERWLRCKDGRLLPVEINTRQLSDEYLLVIARDISQRKQAEQELQQSHNLLRVIIEAAPTAIVGLDLDGNVQMVWNPAAEKMLGWKAEEVMGRPLPSVPVEKHEEFQRFCESIRSGLALDGIPVQRHRRDGSPIDYSIYASPLHNAKGQISGNIAVLVDITDHKQLERRLLESEERFRLLSESALTGTYLIQEDRFRYVNPAMARMFGYTVEELVDQRGPLDLVYPDDRSVVAENLRRCVEDEVAEIHYDFRGQRQDGSMVHIEVHDRRIEYRGKMGVLGTLVDITERKKAEMQVQASEQLFRALVENSPDYVSRYDRDFRRIYVNPALQKLFGKTAEHLLNATPADKSPIYAPKIYLDQLQQVIETATERAIEVQFRTAQDEMHWGHIRFAPEFGSDGQVASVLAIGRDIHEIKQAEAERQVHLRFFTSMDQVNRAIQGANDLEQMMCDVLDALLVIFECDRAWLVYPCDPEAATWQTPMERTRPEYSGVLPVGIELPLEPVGAAVFQILRDNPGPVTFGAGSLHQVPEVMTGVFKVQSFIAVALYPKVGKPWSFGLHQCTYPRVWTPEDQRLFEEIALRLTDGLTSLLAYHNLQESEERYRALYHENPTMFFTLDTQGTIISVNDFGADQLGYPKDELEGQSVLKLCYAEDKADVSELLTTCLQNPWQVFRWQFRKVRKDSSVMWVEEFARTVDGPTGQLYVLVVCQDITERKQTEEALREKTDELDRFFTVAPDLLCIAGLDGYFRRLNPQWEVVLGYSLSQLEGQRFLDFVHPDDQASTLATLGELGAQKTVLDFVNRYRCQDSSYRWIEWRAYPAGNLIYAAARDITEHKQVEEALRESEFFLRKSQAVARLGSYYFDARTGQWISSSALDEIFGIDERFPKDINGWIELIHPEHKDEMLQHLTQHVLAEHNRFDKEYRIIRYNDQRERWMHGLGELEFDEYGNAIKMIGTIQDITERKQAEEVLQLTRFTMESVADAVYWINPEARIIEVNKAACEMLGYTHEELCRLSITDIDPILPMAQWPHLWELIQTTGRNMIESIHRTKTGRLIPVEIIANFIKFGDLELDCAVVRDITERKQVEAQLRTSEARYRALVQSQVDLISRYLPDTTLTFVNDAYCQFYGKKREELIGLSFLTMVAPEFHKLTLEETESLVKEPRSISGEYLNYTWDGQAHWIHWIIQSIVDENGQVIELQAAGRDITPLKQAEEEIHKLNKELEQRVIERTAQLEAVNRELEAFAYSVSHDLRAPLRHIDGFLELLEKRIAPTLDERSQHYMTTISTSAKHMGTLIDDLLSFSRMGRSEMSKRPVDLAGLVQEVIQQLESEAQDRTVRWHIADLPSISGDQAMLRMVLVNLLSNALKFTRGCPQAEIEIGSQPDQGNETIFFVRDNGAGFDMAYADKLFGVFQRLHRADEFEGTGIGLANVRRIIQRHGGRVWAEGQVNQGATFFFSLPQSIQGA